jgi:lysophospholipase L1-like esterase
MTALPAARTWHATSRRTWSRARGLGWARALALVVVTIALSPALHGCGNTDASARWAGAARFEPEIAAFEASDREAMPASGAVLFVGSSSVHMWKTLARDMAPLRAINRGFGGSTIAQVDYYADRIIAPYAPRAVVLYAGDNDLAGKSPKTPVQVLEDFEFFVSRVHELFPGTPIYFLAIKPSLARWSRWPAMARANEMIRSLAETSRDVTYIDVATSMLGVDGKPKASLFIDDGLHLNADGYAVWTKLVKPVLVRETPEPGQS